MPAPSPDASSPRASGRTHCPGGHTAPSVRAADAVPTSGHRPPRSEPTGEAGPHDEPQVIVARIRMTQSLAEAIADTVHQMAAMAAQGGPQTGTSIKH